MRGGGCESGGGAGRGRAKEDEATREEDAEGGATVTWRGPGLDFGFGWAVGDANILEPYFHSHQDLFSLLGASSDGNSLRV